MTQRCACRRSSARSVKLNGEPEAAANSIPLRGQKAITVKIHTAKIEAAASPSHARYRQGVFHPLMRAPNVANNVISDVGAKNRPGSTGKRGPYGISVNDSGGAALHAPATTIGSS